MLLSLVVFALSFTTFYIFSNGCIDIIFVRNRGQVTQRKFKLNRLIFFFKRVALLL